MNRRANNFNASAMSIVSMQVPTQRSSYLSLLQIAGALSIVAFHIGIPFSGAGWIAVELFFVIAGINMTAALDRDQSVASYAWSRVRRLCPELCMVWSFAVVLVISGGGTAGMLWFTGTGPFFLQNLTLPLFDYSFPRDWVFGPLWFIGALLQLQVLLFASKRMWLRAKPMSVIVAFVCFGLSFRLLFAWLVSVHPQTLSGAKADALYCLPFSHVEAIVLGLMIGRGALPAIGRLLPIFGALILSLGALNVWLSHGLVSWRCAGFDFPLRLNYIHVWGYTVLAFAAASLSVKSGPLAVAIESIKRPLQVDKAVERLASLTFGVYLFHGIIMATGVNGSAWLERDHAPVLRLVLFAITMMESFLLAWGFAWFIQVGAPVLLRARLKWQRQINEEIASTNRAENEQASPLGSDAKEARSHPFR